MEPAAALAEAANQTFSPLFRDPSWNFPGLTDVPALPAPACIATVGDYSYVADEDKLFEGTRGPGLPEASGTQRDLVTEPAACELPMHQPTAVDVTLALAHMPASILTCPLGFNMASDAKPSHKAGQGGHTTHEILAYAGLPPLRGRAAVPLHVADASVLYGGVAYPMAAYGGDLDPQSPTHLLHAASPGHFFDDLDDRDSALYPATPAAPPSAPPGFAPAHPHLAAHHLLPEAHTPPQGAATPSSRRTGPHRTRRSTFGTLRASPSPCSPAAAVAAPQLAYAAGFPDGAMPDAAAPLRAGLGSGAYRRLEGGTGSYVAGSYAAGSYGAGSYGEAEGESSDSAFGARSGAGGAFPRPRGGIKKGGGRRTRRMVCRNCATHKTPQWRCGPEGPKTLCNACGLRLRKGQVLERYANLGPGQPFPPPPLGDCMSDSGSPCDSSI